MKKDARAFFPAKLTGLLTLVALCTFGVGFNSCSQQEDTRKQFTAAEVTEIQAALKDVDPATYRVVLPRYENDRRVGSQTLGTLSVADVRRVASEKGVRFEENGNLQAVFFMNTPGSGTTEKPSAQTRGSQSSKEGPMEFNRRLETILSGKDQSAFILIR